MDEKVLLNVEINAKDALENYSKIKIRIDELRDSQKKLKDSGLENSQVYIETEQQIKALSARAQEYQKTIQQQIKADNELTGSLQQMKAQLSLATQEYNKMDADMRKGDAGLKKQQEIVNLTAALNEAEQGLLNYHRQVGNYGMVAKDLAAEMKSLKDQLVGMADAGLQGTAEFKAMRERVDEINRALNPFSDELKSSKSRLKELTQQMIEMEVAGKSDTEEYKNMAQEAANLKDAIGDVQERISNLANDQGKLNAVAQSLSFASNAMATLENTTREADIAVPELQNALRALAMTTSALTLVVQAHQAAQKQTLIYRAAETFINKTHIKDLAKMRIAQLQETAAKSSSIVVTKAATIATAAWNAVLAANPVMLVIGALALLGAALFAGISIWGKSAKAQREAKEASKAYAEQEVKTAAEIDHINAKRSEQVNEISNAMRKEIVEMKKKGKTEKEIAEYQLKKENEIRDVEVASSRARQKETAKLITAKEILLNKEIAYLSTLKQGSKDFEEQKKKVQELKAALRDLRSSQADEKQKEQDLLIKSLEAEQKVRDDQKKKQKEAAKEAARKAKEEAKKRKEQQKKEVDDQLALDKQIADNRLAAEKQADDLSLEIANASEATKFKHQLEWEKKMFDANQAYEKRKLEAQKKRGEITAKDYQTQLAKLTDAEKAFFETQANSAKKQALAQYKNVIAEVGRQTQQMIQDVDEQMADNIASVSTQLGIDDAFKREYENLQGLMAMYDQQQEEMARTKQMMFNASGATEEADRKRFEEMQATMFEYYRVEAELKRQAEEKKTAIEQEAVDKRLGRIYKDIEDANALDLLDFTKTEIEKTNILIEQSQKRIEALKKEAEAETDPKVKLELMKRIAEEENNLRTLRLQNIQSESSKELANAMLTAKERYDIKQEYLQKELEAVRGNADAEAEVMQQMTENRSEYLNSLSEEIGIWSDKAMGAMSAINDAWSAIEENKMQKDEEENENAKENLKKRLDAQKISQEEYDESVAKLDEELDKKKRALARKQAIRQKAMNLMQTSIAAAQAIIQSLAQSPVAIGPFPNPAGIASLALATTTGAAQIAAVAAEPLPKASRGMLLRGPSHAQGGIPIEAEGGEAIINKKATSRYLPLLSAINQSTGGVPLFAGGGVVQPQVRQQQLDYKALAEAMAQIQITPRVAVEDINRGQSNMVKVESLRTF